MPRPAISIRPLERSDIASIGAAFRKIGWKGKTASQYERYLTEQMRGQRVVLVALIEGMFAGYLTVQWRSGYPPFREANIPEIADFNVLPEFRRRGIGTALMDEAERRIADRSPIAGIGVGVEPSYGAAHRLYVGRGYVPDGRGLYQSGRHATYGETVKVNDSLVMFFTKQLRLE